MSQMKCPACESDSSVIETRVRHGGKELARRRRCACGARWSTVEKRIGKYAMGSVADTLPVVARDARDSVPIPLAIAPKTPSGSVGGVGGGLPSDLSDPNLSGPLSDLSLDPSQGVDPARAKAAPVYSKTFEIVWEQTGRRGSKFKANAAWKLVGQPGWDAIGCAWASYLVSERPAAGFIQDLSTWLRARGHTQEWEPGRARRLANGAPSSQRTIQNLNEWMEKNT